MKTIATLLILVLSSLAIVASGPPAPPGFRLPTKKAKPTKGAELLTATALRESAARFVPAAVEPPQTNGVIVASFLLDEGPPFGKSLWSDCRQGSNTVLEVKWTEVINGASDWHLLTVWSCWPTEQRIFVLMNGNWDQAFVRGENIPCSMTFQPAQFSQILLPAKDLLTPWGVRRVQEVGGVDKPANVKIYQQLP
jgi:hypothetical protein